MEKRQCKNREKWEKNQKKQRSGPPPTKEEKKLVPKKNAPDRTPRCLRVVVVMAIVNFKRRSSLVCTFFFSRLTVQR